MTTKKPHMDKPGQKLLNIEGSIDGGNVCLECQPYTKCKECYTQVCSECHSQINCDEAIRHLEDEDAIKAGQKFFK